MSVSSEQETEAMWIRLVEVVGNGDVDIFITFESHVGRAKGHWGHSSFIAEVGKKYGVEMDITEVIDRRTNTTDGRQGIRALSILNDDVILEGDVEGVDDENIGHLRIADDCIVCIEVSGDFQEGEALRITIPYRSLRVFPVGI